MKRGRREKGEGSVYQGADGRWRASVTVGYDDAGRQRRLTASGATKVEALQKLRDLRQKAEDGQTAAAPAFRNFCDDWLLNVKGKVEGRTHERYEEHIRLYIKPRLGRYQLDQLRGLHVTGLLQWMEAEGKSASNRRRVLKCLRQVLNHAIRQRLIRFNPAKEVDAPKVNRAVIQPFTLEHVTRFLEVVREDRHFTLYVTAIDSGMRQGELWALQWPDINLETGVVTVNKALAEIKSTLVIKRTKTQGSRRTVQLSPQTVQVLKEHRAKMEAAGLTTAPTPGAKKQGLDGAPVFGGPDGGYLRRRNFHRDSFQPALKRANATITAEAEKRKVEPVLLPKIRFHDLRHTCATLLLLLDESPKVVAERLGHSKISLTMDTYTHVAPKLQQRAAEKMGGVLTAALAAATADQLQKG